MIGKDVSSRLLNENARYGISTFEVIIGAPETPQTIEALASPFGCPQELDGKTTLLRILHT